MTCVVTYTLSGIELSTIGPIHPFNFNFFKNEFKKRFQIFQSDFLSIYLFPSVWSIDILGVKKFKGHLFSSFFSHFVTLFHFSFFQTGRFLSRSHISHTISTSSRMWDHEYIDARYRSFVFYFSFFLFFFLLNRNPKWLMFRNGLSAAQSFRLGKDSSTLCIGDSNAPLYFQVVELSKQ